jgi:hypothetical protein
VLSEATPVQVVGPSKLRRSLAGLLRRGRRNRSSQFVETDDGLPPSPSCPAISREAVISPSRSVSRRGRDRSASRPGRGGIARRSDAAGVPRRPRRREGRRVLIAGRRFFGLWRRVGGRIEPADASTSLGQRFSRPASRAARSSVLLRISGGERPPIIDRGRRDRAGLARALGRSSVIRLGELPTGLPRNGSSLNGGL